MASMALPATAQALGRAITVRLPRQVWKTSHQPQTLPAQGYHPPIGLLRVGQCKWISSPVQMLRSRFLFVEIPQDPQSAISKPQQKILFLQKYRQYFPCSVYPFTMHHVLRNMNFSFLRGLLPVWQPSSVQRILSRHSPTYWYFARLIKVQTVCHL